MTDGDLIDIGQHVRRRIAWYFLIGGTATGYFLGYAAAFIVLPLSMFAGVLMGIGMAAERWIEEEDDA